MTRRPYHSYKDASFTNFGPIPTHWSERRLKTLLSEPLMYGANEAADGDDPDNPRFVRITDIDESGQLREETFKSLPPTVAEPYLLREGDVLLARSGATVGKSIIYREAWGVCCFAGYLIRARFDARKGMRASFFAYCCQSKFYWDFVLSNQIQATIQNLSAERYANLFLPCPPIQEQELIEVFLDLKTAKIDTLIAEQVTLIERLREKRQAVLTTGISKGLDPSIPMRESGVAWIGEIPSHWSVIPLKKAIDFQEGPGIMAEDFRDEGVPLLRVGNVSASMVTLEGCNFLDPEKVKTRWNHFKLSEGDLLISASASMGTVCEVGSDAEGSIAYTGIIRLREVPGISCKGFLRHFVVSYPYLAQIETFKAGTAIQHYGPVHLRQMFFICPPVKEQMAIAVHVDRELASIDRLISEAETSIALLQEHRAAIVTAVVTGKVDVREATS